MNLRLNYRGTGQAYSEHFSNFKVKVSLAKSGRVNISFREKTETESKSVPPYASFSLPPQKARQLGAAVDAVSLGDAEPVEFSIEE